VSDPGGEKIYLGVTFLSLFSKLVSSLIEDNKAHTDIPTVIVPVPFKVLKQLLCFLSIGEVVCSDEENAISVHNAADLLGISKKDWTFGSGGDLENVITEDWKVEMEEGDQSIGETVDDQGINHDSLFGRKNTWITQKGRVNQSPLSSVQKEVLLVKKFFCDMCEKGYLSKGSLIAHTILKHSQLSPHNHKLSPKNVQSARELLTT